MQSALAVHRTTVLSALTAAPEGLFFRQLIRELAIPASHLVCVLRGLRNEGVVVQSFREEKPLWRLVRPGDTTFKAPPVRQVAIPTFDQAELAALVEELLADGTTQDVLQLVASARPRIVHATRETVGVALASLVHAGRVAVVPMGAFTRYRRIAPEVVNA